MYLESLLAFLTNIVLLKQVIHLTALLWKGKNSLSKPSGHTSAAEVQLHTFLTLALDVGEWLTSCPGHFNSITQWRRGRMSPEMAWTFWRRESSLPLTWFKPPTSRLLPSHYTNYATMAIVPWSLRNKNDNEMENFNV